jgi:hypothetical protein
MKARLRNFSRGLDFVTAHSSMLAHSVKEFAQFQKFFCPKQVLIARICGTSIAPASTSHVSTIFLLLMLGSLNVRCFRVAL